MQRRSQADRAQSTRTALIDAATMLFGEHGYAGVPAEQIVAAAGVSRGALYHHFGDKEGLFRAVFVNLEASLNEEIGAVLAAVPERWPAMLGALSQFLDACQRPEVLQIALTDAPAVLGWQDWRQIEAEYGLGLITESLQRAVDEGLLHAEPVGVVAQLLLSALIEAALMISHSEDAAAARSEAEQGLLLMISGLLK